MSKFLFRLFSNHIQIYKLLRLLPILLQYKLLGLKLLRCIQKAKCLAVFFGVLGVVYVVRVHHPLQVVAALARNPFDTLVYDDVVEDHIKNAIAQDAQPH